MTKTQVLRRRASLALTVGLALGSWSAARAGVSATLLPGTFSNVNASGISADGEHVIGSATVPSSPRMGVVWTHAGSPNLIVSAGGYSLEAAAISGDGSVLVGSASAPFGGPRPFRWTVGDGIVILQTPAGTTNARAWCVTPDGAFAHGSAITNGISTGLRWDASGHAASYAPMAGDVGSGVLWAADDGEIAVGATFDAAGNARAVRWMSPGLAPTLLPALAGQTRVLVRGMSGDGAIMVGTCGPSSSEEQPVAWDAANQIIPLAIPAGFQYGFAVGTSGDGSLIYGSIWKPDHTTRAVIWVDQVPIILSDLLVANGVPGQLASTLLLTGASADGRFLSAVTLGDQHPYLIEVPAPCGGLVLGAGVLVCGRGPGRRAPKGR